MQFNHDYVDSFFDYNSSSLKNCAASDFEKNFVEIACAYRLDPLCSAVIARRILEQMGHHSLHYHTPVHVLAMLQFYDKFVKPHLTLTHEVLTAIFFHDVVYLPGSETNEAESVRWMKNVFGPWLPFDDREEVISKAILDTALYYKDDLDSSHCLVLMDLDLCNFAFDFESYNTASELVMKEFEFNGKDVVRAGRKEFLKKLISRPKIYRTPLFQELFEEKARKNIDKTLLSS